MCMQTTHCTEIVTKDHVTPHELMVLFIPNTIFLSHDVFYMNVVFYHSLCAFHLIKQKLYPPQMSGSFVCVLFSCLGVSVHHFLFNITKFSIA